MIFTEILCTNQTQLGYSRWQHSHIMEMAVSLKLLSTHFSEWKIAAYSVFQQGSNSSARSLACVVIPIGNSDVWEQTLTQPVSIYLCENMPQTARVDSVKYRIC